jgi:hypothetical protein
VIRLLSEPQVVTWTTNEEYRVVVGGGPSLIAIASCDEYEEAHWLAEQMRQQPSPIIRNMFDMMRAGIKLQGREDTFAGHVRLTASQRAYVAGALAEAYMGGAVAAPSTNRLKWHADIAEAVLGPLRLER